MAEGFDITGGQQFGGTRLPPQPEEQQFMAAQLPMFGGGEEMMFAPQVMLPPEQEAPPQYGLVVQQPGGPPITGEPVEQAGYWGVDPTVAARMWQPQQLAPPPVY